LFEIIDGNISKQGTTLELPGIRIQEELSRGANGIVFSAHDNVLDRKVAVKIWTKLRQKDRRDKALQGAKEVRKSLSATRQPRYEYHIRQPYEDLFYSAIADIYSAGYLADGTFYVVMEFIHGVTLREWLQKNEFPIGRKFYIAEALTELDAQWEKSGIFHGDLHWNNVMIENDIRPKNYWEIAGRAPKIRVLDFGTSHFGSSSKQIYRHFKVLAETVARCILPVQLDQILPDDKPRDLGTAETRAWLQKSICAFRAALFLVGRESVGWPYRLDPYSGYKVPNHTDISKAKLLVKALGLDKKFANEVDPIGTSKQWSEFDGRYDKLPGD
jgi:serine/threonine protein kinase